MVTRTTQRAEAARKRDRDRRIRHTRRSGLCVSMQRASKPTARLRGSSSGYRRKRVRAVISPTTANKLISASIHRASNGTGSGGCTTCGV